MESEVIDAVFREESLLKRETWQFGEQYFCICPAGFFLAVHFSAVRWMEGNGNLVGNTNTPNLS